ncbi:diacylglycerol kinase (ATP) [Candidatus Nanopelagicus abundans]|uniref:Diacylglycerol kinase (ATP) n=1 Tax=Candidatus Nanopelagicus abundans TaxID=1884916 RepID=A0A249L4A9_9ACTN|nr:YegS/Rv2252/BmrU family lipid kinase [Candidatus Nanopelagicus abundans]ASY23882.1 diacylglycerol kinase (ATP) [Candidatus Nanopelagicus abundans]
MWLLVANETAGKGKALQLANQFTDLLSQANQEFTLINEKSYEKTIEKLKAELSTNFYSKLIAVGGDGLVNLCLQHLAQSGLTLGVIPAGTGNDFARAVGLNKMSMNELFNLFTRTDPIKIDLGHVKSSTAEKWFVQVLSTGFDAEVNSRANKIKWPRGKSKYTISTVRTLARFKPINYKIDIDSRKFDQSAMLFTIANGETYGGGMRICPGASNSDGFFEILLVRPVSRFVLLTIFPKVFKGNHIPHQKIDTYRAKVVTISAPTSAYADGEYVAHLPITVTNVGNALSTWLAP